MRKHAESPKLLRAVSRCLGHVVPLAKTVYRATAVDYSNRDDLLTGQGAKINGGRWNPPASCATVYTSVTPETALAEYLAHHRYYGIPDSDAMPYVMVGLEVALQRVLDFTDGSVRSALAVSEARTLDSSWREAKGQESLPQALGRIAYEAEFEAIVVPLRRRQGHRQPRHFPRKPLASRQLDPDRKPP